VLEDYRKIIEKIRNEVEELRKEFDEEFGKYVEDEYAYYDQIYSEENWWKTLKIKWEPEGLKKFIRFESYSNYRARQYHAKNY
jgi:hypothetical protein